VLNACVKEVRILGKKSFKPGQKIPESGQAEIVNRLGKPTGIERTVVEGKPFPPTPKKNQTYFIVDKTKHKK